MANSNLISKINLTAPQRTLWALVGGTAILFLTSCNRKPDHPSSQPAPTRSEKSTNEIVAEGGAIRITRERLSEEVRRLASEVGKFDPKLPESDGNVSPATIEKWALEIVINKYLLLARATEQDRKKGEAEYVAHARKDFAPIKISKNILGQNQRNTETGAQAAPATLTADELDRELRQHLPRWMPTVERWKAWEIENHTANVVLERELERRISEQDIKKYYDDHPDISVQPAYLRVKLILLRTVDPATGLALTEDQKRAKREKMSEILRRARQGEEFEMLAREFSEIDGAGNKDRDYVMSRGNIPSTLEAAILNLEPNQISEVLVADFGYQVIKVINKAAASKMPLSEVRDTITVALKANLVSVYLSNARAEAKLIFKQATTK